MHNCMDATYGRRYTGVLSVELDVHVVTAPCGRRREPRHDSLEFSRQRH